MCCLGCEFRKKHFTSLFLFQEYIIFDWKENKAEFHNRLVLCYKDRILPLLREHIESLPEGKTIGWFLAQNSFTIFGKVSDEEVDIRPKNWSAKYETFLWSILEN